MSELRIQVCEEKSSNKVRRAVAHSNAALRVLMGAAAAMDLSASRGIPTVGGAGSPRNRILAMGVRMSRKFTVSFPPKSCI